MIIPNIISFNGQHCETTATGTLLFQAGINLSEPMLFGLGEGLSFIFWNMKTMDFPFIGGRLKPDQLTVNICKNLNLELTVKETISKEKAWKKVRELIDKQQVVGLKLDCFHLEYFSTPIHFAAHYAAIYGYNDDSAFLIDTAQQGGKVKTSLKSLELARAQKGPMASKSLYYTINKSGKNYDLGKSITNAIKNNAKDYINPPIINIGYKGILKASTEIKTWFNNSKDIESEFKTSAMLMEKAGTGGSLFRNLYRDFLEESNIIIRSNKLKQAHKEFIEIAKLWKSVSELFEKVSNTKDIAYVDEATDILNILSAKEKHAMELLIDL